MQPVSVYIHIPFCERRCGYCDFNTYAGIERLIPAYVEAVCSEIQSIGKSGEISQIGSIYFGGGTPSLVHSQLVGKMLAHIGDLGTFLDDIEITLEVNPGTVNQDYLADLYELGVNRLSIGVQSANRSELQLLDRLHGYDEAVRVVAEARNVGFENLSLDFIYGLPHQQIDAWSESLDAALALKPEHLSLYALSIEAGTPLEHKVLAGIYPDPDPDLTADMYEYALDTLTGNGFVHYEISNWARKTEKGDVLVSAHNRQYWLNEPYLGIGAGAHGFVGGYRTINESLPAQYIQKLINGGDWDFPKSPATTDLIEIDRYREMQETMFMGLRLLEEGVSEERFTQRFGVGYWEVFEKELQTLLNKGLLEVANDSYGARRLKIAPKGVFVSNLIFQEFI